MLTALCCYEHLSPAVSEARGTIRVQAVDGRSQKPLDWPFPGLMSLAGTLLTRPADSTEDGKHIYHRVVGARAAVDVALAVDDERAAFAGYCASSCPSATRGSNLPAASLICAVDVLRSLRHLSRILHLRLSPRSHGTEHSLQLRASATVCPASSPQHGIHAQCQLHVLALEVMDGDGFLSFMPADGAASALGITLLYCARGCPGIRY